MAYKSDTETRVKNRERSLYKYLSLALISAPMLQACGGSGGTSASIKSGTTKTEEVPSIITVGREPKIAPLPLELVQGETDLGKIYITDENPETVVVIVESTGSFSVVYEPETGISLDDNEVVSSGDIIEFKVQATDEDGQTTVIHQSVTVVNQDSDQKNLLLSYDTVENSSDVVVFVNIPSNAITDGSVEGMQFDIEFDPSVFTYNSGSFDQKGFAIYAVNSEMAGQGLIRVAVASVDPQVISNLPMIEITLAMDHEFVDSVLEFSSISVDGVDFSETEISIIA